jgi:hypothetical protein
MAGVPERTGLQCKENSGRAGLPGRGPASRRLRAGLERGRRMRGKPMPLPWGDLTGAAPPANVPEAAARPREVSGAGNAGAAREGPNVGRSRSHPDGDAVRSRRNPMARAGKAGQGPQAPGSGRKTAGRERNLPENAFARPDRVMNSGTGPAGKGPGRRRYAGRRDAAVREKGAPGIGRMTADEPSPCPEKNRGRTAARIINGSRRP